MLIGDGTNDGEFIIKKGEGLSQAIVSELGLKESQVKLLNKSVWSEILSYISEENKNNQIYQENFIVHEGQNIKLTPETWDSILKTINKHLKLDLKKDLAVIDFSTEIKQKSKDTVEVFAMTNEKVKIEAKSKKSEDERSVDKIRLEDYSLENLEKKYPKDKYLIKTWNNGDDEISSIDVYSKENSNRILSVEFRSYGTDIYEYNDDGRVYIHEFDENGKLISYENKKGKHYTLADDIYNAITKRKYGIIPTTGDLGALIKDLTKNNVVKILEAYSKDYKESLFEAILEERGLDINQRIAYVKQIKDTLIEYYKDRGVYCDDISKEFDKELLYQKNSKWPANSKFLDVLVEQLERRSTNKFYSDSSGVANGKLDKDFQQGYTGDCWLVATIKALSNNPISKEKLESLISVDSNGNVTVTLKGVNKKYTFTKEEIAGATELSSGDMDVRAIELAVNKYFHEERAHSKNPHHRRDISQGGQAQDALQILFGKGGRSMLGESLYGSLWDALFRTGDNLIEKIKSGEYICMVSDGIGAKKTTAENDEGKEVEIIGNHVYSVVDADDKYIYIVNPHDTSQVLKITHENFKKSFNSADLIKVSDL